MYSPEPKVKPHFLADIGPPYENRVVFMAAHAEKANTFAEWLREDPNVDVSVYQIKMANGPVVVAWKLKGRC